MPKVKTNRVKYPEGWELIEPTLRELEQKMREGKKKLVVLAAQLRWLRSGPFKAVVLYHLQPKVTPTKESENAKLCGPSSRYRIRRVVSSTIFTTEERQFRRSFTIFVWTKTMLTATLLPSGKRFVQKMMQQ